MLLIIRQKLDKNMKIYRKSYVHLGWGKRTRGALELGRRAAAVARSSADERSRAGGPRAHGDQRRAVASARAASARSSADGGAAAGARPATRAETEVAHVLPTQPMFPSDPAHFARCERAAEQAARKRFGGRLLEHAAEQAAWRRLDGRNGLVTSNKHSP